MLSRRCLPQNTSCRSPSFFVGAVSSTSSSFFFDFGAPKALNQALKFGVADFGFCASSVFLDPVVSLSSAALDVFVPLTLNVFSSLTLDGVRSSSSSSFERVGDDTDKLLQIKCMESTFFNTVPKLSFGSSSRSLLILD